MTKLGLEVWVIGVNPDKLCDVVYIVCRQFSTISQFSICTTDRHQRQRHETDTGHEVKNIQLCDVL